VRTPPKMRKRFFVLLLPRGGQKNPYYGSHEQSAAHLHPPHDRLGAQHHRIKKPFHATNLPFAFDELYEIRAPRSYRPRPGPNTIHQ
jgi:hypothetical protein